MAKLKEDTDQTTIFGIALGEAVEHILVGVKDGERCCSIDLNLDLTEPLRWTPWSGVVDSDDPG